MSTAACAATGIFRRRNSAFSCSRSCETSSAARGGRMSVIFSSGASASPEMFSQSNVTTSLAPASSSRSSRDPRARPTKMGATWAPGASALRSRNVQREPQGIPGKRQHAAQLPRADDADVREFQGCRGSGLSSTAAVCADRKRVERKPYFGGLVGEDRRGEQGGIPGARGADGEGGHGYSARHLRNGQQRVDAAQGLGRHRYAQHGHRGLGRGHSGQVCCTARTGNDGLEPALARRSGVFEQQVGRAMRRDDPHLVRDRQAIERVGGPLHRLPVGRRSHDDPDEGFHGPSLTKPTRATGAERRKARGRRRASAARAARFPPFPASWQRRPVRLRVFLASNSATPSGLRQQPVAPALDLLKMPNFRVVALFALGQLGEHRLGIDVCASTCRCTGAAAPARRARAGGADRAVPSKSFPAGPTPRFPGRAGPTAGRRVPARRPPRACARSC